MERHAQQGAYVRIGNSCNYILKETQRQQEIDARCQECLPQAEVDAAANAPTMIRKLTEAEYERLFRHGYETADYTLYAFHADPDAQPVQFSFKGYGALQARLKPPG